MINEEIINKDYIKNLNSILYEKQTFKGQQHQHNNKIKSRQQNNKNQNNITTLFSAVRRKRPG